MDGLQQENFDNSGKWTPSDNVNLKDLRLNLLSDPVNQVLVDLTLHVQSLDPDQFVNVYQDTLVNLPIDNQNVSRIPIVL